MSKQSDDYTKSEGLLLSEAKQRFSLNECPKNKAITASKPYKRGGVSFDCAQEPNRLSSAELFF
jgi:hypothetical protein